MYLKNKYNIANTYKSFVRYIKIYRKYILVDLYKYETNGAFYTEKEIDDYVELKLLKKLDDELFSILSVGEKIALEVLEKRNDGYNHLCDILIKNVYEKWQNIFFKDESKYYKKLSPMKIGLKMKLIREANDVSKTELAIRLKVNRKTVILLEKGDRLPSLEYIYNFCKMFDVSIELMLN